MLSDYTDQQSRIDRAFSFGGTCCQTTCEACGRTYFVTSPGHGDYNEGELELLYERAKQQPDKCIEVPDYSSVNTMWMPTNGKEVVIGCVCDPTKPLSDFIEENAEQLTVYLDEYWKAKGADAAREHREAQEALAKLGWSQMSCAPRTGEWIEVELEGGVIVEAHWASDLSGEEQPLFEGWFERFGNGFRQVHPLRWRRVAQLTEQP